MTDEGPLEPTQWDSLMGRHRRRASLEGAGTLGVTIFLVSLSVLFLASLVGYLVVRLRADEWGPGGGDRYPEGLWISTLVILAASVTVHRALRAARLGDGRGTYRMLLTTLALGAAFLLLQTINWIQLASDGITARTGLYGFTFYIFTVLHALHVVGGIIPLVASTRRARRGGYSVDDHAGVLHVAMYWHFLDAVWMVLFVVILIG
jgi:heme/copper-type cytochrome/quinol oxidase subunit 3